MKRAWTTGTVGLALAATMVLAPSLQARAASPVLLADGDSDFSIADIRAGRVSDIPPPPRPSGQEARHGQQDLAVAQSPTGVLAIVDRSMLRQGITSAASPSFVDLSWEAPSRAAQYGISRDGELLATLPVGASNFRDTAVVGGRTYRYEIVSLRDTDTDWNARMWSMNVRVPTAPAMGEGLSRSLHVQAVAATRKGKGASATTTITWETFIPQRRVDAPPVGCDYGNGYEFGGDGHGYDWKSSSYRTAVHAVIDWKKKSVQGHVSIGTTHVYRKKDGKLVSKKTASGSKSYAKKMGSGSDYVDVRMVTHASNPYCGVTAIDGAFSIHLTQKGDYAIFSGNHRQMPNHYVYIYDGGKVTDVYKHDAASPLCLVGAILCDLTPFYGRGSF
ncbi:hypothetical protein KYC5002_34590 [Archangium violaceum]|uniref:hypothetical protein n=1 Tax=Archangium violaceum TaxID=83451 RepID=UPI002B2B566A|nr:hypothetical protein KYC5002_34590 [Archangium gephyra]